MMIKPDDKRSHPRVPIKLVVDLTATDDKTKRLAMAKDVSLGGMFVEVSKPLPLGKSVVVGISTSGGPAPILLPGTVRWNHPTGIGIEFGPLGAREKSLILGIYRRR
jgi:Tfp pilus assembly protein PilZ